MSKASAKEPSMDEILSSIRQIIADDDAGATPPAPPAETTTPSPAPAAETAPAAGPAPIAEKATAEDDALSLSPEQIVEAEPVKDVASVDDAEVEQAAAALAEDDEFTVPDLVEPDDISFDAVPAAESEPELAAPEPATEAPEQAKPQPESAMPDPNLSGDIADELLEPATNAAVKATFAKLSNVSLGSQSLTIENMIREMLRPMLKDWLDENLPSVVEKMVEKEIERISRGG